MCSYMRHSPARWRAERSTISERASDQIAASVDAGNYEALERARLPERRFDAADARVWSKEAREIRKRRRMVTGVKGYDQNE